MKTMGQLKQLKHKTKKRKKTVENNTEMKMR